MTLEDDVVQKVCEERATMFKGYAQAYLAKTGLAIDEVCLCEQPCDVGRVYFLKPLSEIPQPRPWHVVGKDPLPDTDRRVCVTVLYVLRGRKSSWGTEIWRYDERKKEWMSSSWKTERFRNCMVKAWMELPEPYQGEAEDEG